MANTIDLNPFGGGDSAGGDIVGPASSTDNAVSRFDGTTGKLLQNSVVIIGDTGNTTGLGTVASGEITSSSLTASRALVSGALKEIQSSAVTATELSYVSGVTSAIQTQLGTKVTGPASATDNAITRYDGTTGKLVQDSVVAIADTTGAITGPQSIQMAGSTSGTFTQSPAATTTSYSVVWPSAQASGAQVLRNDGSGNLSWFTDGGGDVVGPASSTDNAIVRFDSTTGKLVQNSTVIVGDTGAITDVLSITGVTAGSTITGGTATTATLTLKTTTGVGTTNADMIFQVGNNGATEAMRILNSGNVGIGATIPGQKLEVAGNILLKNASGAQPELHLSEDPDNGTSVIKIKAPAALTGDVTFTLPDNDGSASQLLQTDGSGVLSWVTVSGTGDVVGPASATDNAIVRFDGTTGKLVQNSVVSVADTTGAITGPQSIQMAGSTSGTFTQSPTATTTSYSVIWPSAQASGAQVLQNDGSGNLSWATASGTGDVVGPASSTDNAIVRFDSTTGKLVQNSTVTVSDTGALAGVLSVVFPDTTQTGAAVAAKNYVQVVDQKTAGTQGGTFTSGAWRTRTLNTEVSDAGNLCSLSGDQITLTAGTYYCRISAPAFVVTLHKTLLYNATDASNIIIGTTERSNAGDATQTRSFISGLFTIGASKALEVRHQCSVTRATDGMGGAAGFSEVEIYTVAEFWLQPA